MKERMKWIAVGFGFIVGVQALTTLLFMMLFQATHESTGALNQYAMVLFGLTLAAFLLGGFIIGRVGAEARILDALTAAAGALLFSAFIYLVLPEGTRDLYTGSKWLTQAVGVPAPTWLSALQMLPAFGAAALGAFLGYQMASPVETALERFYGFVGLASAFAGVVVVYVIGSIVLAWYWLAVLLVALIAGIALSYRFFKHGEHEMEDNAIIAEHRRESATR
jgi:hypothetical protein